VFVSITKSNNLQIQTTYKKYTIAGNNEIHVWSKFSIAEVQYIV